MSKMNFEEVADRAIQISELIEEIIQLDDLIALHNSYGANDDISVLQYKDRRQEFIEQLNELLLEHHLKVVIEDKAA